MVNRNSPIIYKIGIKNDWTSKFIEKKRLEFKTISYKTNKIEEFVSKLFLNNNLKILFFRLFINRNSLQMFVIYDFFYQFVINNKYKINFINKQLSVKSLTFLLKLVNVFNILKLQKYLKIKYFKLNFLLVKKKFNALAFKVKLNSEIKRLKLLKFINFLQIKYKNLATNFHINYFINKLFISLNFLFKNKILLFITIKQISKNNSFLINTKQTRKHFVLNLIKLRKFENNVIFKELINFIYKSKNIKDKAYLLTKYLKLKLEQLKNFRLFNFFFNFIKNAIKHFFIKTNIIKSVKIVFKGNLTKKQRAVTKIVKIGDNVNNSTINLNLNFYKLSCFTKKGTLGIKTFIT